MNPIRFPPKIFPSAGEDADACRLDKATEQTLSPTYRLAFTDDGFMLRDELRPVRLQLELLKPELTLAELGIDSTVVIFGSARISCLDDARARFEKAQGQASENPDSPQCNRELKTAERALRLAVYYEEARKLGRLLTELAHREKLDSLVVVTGGGPGIMEAANRGACEAGGKSMGLNIVLPHEQSPNPYITPELCFQFHYFAIRKMHFLMRAKALVACPGGYGTLDELFETLTLIQTKKIKPMPVLLMGEQYWRELINFDLLVDEGMISPEDLDLFHYVDSAEDAVQKMRDFYFQED